MRSVVGHVARSVVASYSGYSVRTRINCQLRVITKRARQKVLLQSVAKTVVVVTVLPGGSRVRPRLRRIQSLPSIVREFFSARGIVVIGDGGDLPVVLGSIPVGQTN